ncbi:MAG: AMP-binding protein, partial [bacterium]|nr:AMP-binding protein [bacterium]
MAELYQRIKKYPESRITVTSTSGETDHTVTYGEISRRITVLAGALTEEGIIRGAPVFIINTAPIDYIAGLVAIMTVGGMAVPINKNI